jgi:hypothetical protein
MPRALWPRGPRLSGVRAVNSPTARRAQLRRSAAGELRPTHSTRTVSGLLVIGASTSWHVSVWRERFEQQGLDGPWWTRTTDLGIKSPTRQCWPKGAECGMRVFVPVSA